MDSIHLFPPPVFWHSWARVLRTLRDGGANRHTHTLAQFPMLSIKINLISFVMLLRRFFVKCFAEHDETTTGINFVLPAQYVWRVDFVKFVKMIWTVSDENVRNEDANWKREHSHSKSQRKYHHITNIRFKWFACNKCNTKTCTKTVDVILKIGNSNTPFFQSCYRKTGPLTQSKDYLIKNSFFCGILE